MSLTQNNNQERKIEFRGGLTTNFLLLMTDAHIHIDFLMQGLIESGKIKKIAKFLDILGLLKYRYGWLFLSLQNGIGKSWLWGYNHPCVLVGRNYSTGSCEVSPRSKCCELTVGRAKFRFLPLSVQHHVESIGRYRYLFVACVIM